MTWSCGADHQQARYANVRWRAYPRRPVPCRLWRCVGVGRVLQTLRLAVLPPQCRRFGRRSSCVPRCFVWRHCDRGKNHWVLQLTVDLTVGPSPERRYSHPFSLVRSWNKFRATSVKAKRACQRSSRRSACKFAVHERNAPIRREVGDRRAPRCSRAGPPAKRAQSSDRSVVSGRAYPALQSVPSESVRGESESSFSLAALGNQINARTTQSGYIDDLQFMMWMTHLAALLLVIRAPLRSTVGEAAQAVTD